MAQFGRALRSGRRGRGFESRRFDSLAGAPENPLFIRVSGVFSLFFYVSKIFLSVVKFHLFWGVTQNVTQNFFEPRKEP